MASEESNTENWDLKLNYTTFDQLTKEQRDAIDRAKKDLDARMKEVLKQANARAFFNCGADEALIQSVDQLMEKRIVITSPAGIDPKKVMASELFKNEFLTTSYMGDNACEGIESPEELVWQQDEFLRITDDIIATAQSARPGYVEIPRDRLHELAQRSRTYHYCAPRNKRPAQAKVKGLLEGKTFICKRRLRKYKADEKKLFAYMKEYNKRRNKQKVISLADNWSIQKHGPRGWLVSGHGRGDLYATENLLVMSKRRAKNYVVRYLSKGYTRPTKGALRNKQNRI